MKDNLLEALKQLLIDSVDPSKLGQISESEDWLVEQENNHAIYVNQASSNSIRVLDWLERERLSDEAIRFIWFLEQIKVLNKANKEQLIENLLSTDSELITRNEVKWAVLGMLEPAMNTDQQTFINFVLTQDVGSKH